MARAFATCRLGQLAFSSLMVAGDHRRYRHRWAQVALLGGSTLESAWLVRRILGAGGYEDRAGMWADTVFSSVGLLACEAALGHGGAAPWMKNIAIGAALGAASPADRADSAAAMSVLGAAGVLAGLHARGRDVHVAGTALAVNDVISWTGMFAAARIYVESYRRNARLRDDADALVVERAAETASQDERSRQHRLLHRGTVAALEGLAQTDDPLVAGRLARHEAARLRHALRTRGEAPTGLDAILCDITEAVAERGLRVELVTAELGGGEIARLEPDAVRAAGDVALTALLAAREFGDAERAVVRAAAEDGWVVLTVRDRGRGFVPGTGSEYEARLSRLADGLAAVRGSLQVSSQPGGGVRVALTMPVKGRSPQAASALEGGADHAPHGLPLGARRGRRAGHDHRVSDHGDVERGAVGRLVGAAQHEAGGIVVDDVDARSGGEPAQPGVEQGQTGQDPGRGAAIHDPTMPSQATPVMGRSTPFGPAASPEAARAERTILAAVLTWRLTGLATGVAAFAAGQRRYRSRVSGLAQLSVAVCESAWLVRRVWRHSRWDRTATTLDALTAILVVCWGRANLRPEDRPTWLNWAPWSFAANAVTTQAIGVERPWIGMMGAAAIAGANAAGNVTAEEFVANTGAIAAFFVGARLFAAQIRGGAVRLDAARSHAVRAGVTLAGERERAAQLRVLHDGALQTLEAVGSGRYRDIEGIRAEAGAEVRKLRREIDGVSQPGGSFVEGIDAVIREQIRLGLSVDLDWGAVVAPRPAIARALRDACHEALVNVRKHAHTDRATVIVRTAAGGVEVVVADAGQGFDPLAVPAGFGRAESITARLAAVGGKGEILSAPGEGTSVVLWAPP